MEYPQLIDPEQGKTYLNRNGCTYHCIKRIDAETAVITANFQLQATIREIANA